VNYKIYLIFLIISCGLIFVVIQQGRQLHEAETSRDGLKSMLQPETLIKKAATGETMAVQPKAVVDRQTFNDLTQDDIIDMERRMGAKIGKVEGLIKATLASTNIVKVPVRDTVLIHDTVKVQAKSIRWKGKFESGSVLIHNDSAHVKTESINRLAVLETKDRWKIKHLWPGYWGTRKKRVSLLVYNPGTSIDTLYNLSVIQ